MVRYWSEIADCNLPHPYLASAISHFGSLPVCDEQTDRQTDGLTHDDSKYRAIA